MALHIYDSLLREKVPFTTAEPGKVLMYNCGPTVYGTAHIGNFRSFLFADTLRRWLELSGYEVRQVMNITDVGHMREDADEGEDKMAVAAAREDSPEMAIVDLKMPGRGGLELVRDLKEIDGSTKIVVLTGYGSIATAIEAVKLGASNYLSKPADADDIEAAFERGDAPVLDPASKEYKAPSLARVEWEHINRVLADCGGNISEAARRLGIHRRSLQRKLQKYAPR